MDTGYGKRKLVIEISADVDSMVAKLLDISEKASELSLAAKSLIRDLQQEQTGNPETASD